MKQKNRRVPASTTLRFEIDALNHINHAKMMLT